MVSKCRKISHLYALVYHHEYKTALDYIFSIFLHNINESVVTQENEKKECMKSHLYKQA